MTDWSNCRNILCIRPDNMGDLLMSGPAIRAIKTSFETKITVLTSSMATAIAALMPEIDEVMVFDVPWVKTQEAANKEAVAQIVSRLAEKKFDAAVIFTVFSQNPLPSAMLAYLAGIPKVLAYCRENPYGLLSDWVPDEEPYALIRHQVERDLHLVGTIGAKTTNQKLHLTVTDDLWPGMESRLGNLGWQSEKPWMVLHAGVSEIKRQYPVEHWIATAKMLTAKGYQILLTGTVAETELNFEICRATGEACINATGLFNLDELVCLIRNSLLLLSVNTGPVHIAAAVATPVVVLYAQTNPQHTPWQVPNRVLEFPVSPNLHSKNEVIRYLQRTLYYNAAVMPGPVDVVNAVEDLLRQSVASALPSA